MAMTKAAFRTDLRKKVGDDIRLSGTATGGSTYTLISSALQQPDGNWDGMQLIITDTTDDLAPKGEVRTIAQSTFSDTTVRTELPFSADIENNDTFAIAVFDDAKYDTVTRKTLKSFSRMRALQFSEDLVVTASNKRFTPTSAADIIHVSKIEFFNAATQEHLVYKDADWFWDERLQQIEFEWFWGENKTLKLHGNKYHPLPAAETTNYTVLDRDLDNFLDLCAVDFLLDMTERDFYDKFGKLNPSMIKRKDVVKDYKSMREFLLQYADKVHNRIVAEYSSPVSVATGGQTATPFGAVIDKHADPDGWTPSPIFWTVS